MLDPECWNGVRELGRAEEDEEDGCECERGDERNEGGANDDDDGTKCET